MLFLLLLLLSPPSSVVAFVPTRCGLTPKRIAPSTQLKAANFNLGQMFDLQKAANLVWSEVRAGTREGQEELDRLRSWVTKKVGAEPEDVMCSRFGELVKDMQYKKIYAISCEKLVEIPIWEKQRVFRPERSRLIADDIKAKLKAGQALTLPGVISLYDMRDTGEHAILDGQHRVGALQLLADEGVLSPDAHLILIEVFTVDSKEDCKRLFTEINTCQPVNIIDLPDMVSQAEKDIINNAAEMLRLAHKDMFKPSTNCRLPHLNIDNLRDELFKANVVGRLGFSTADQLLEWIKERNKVLSSRTDAEWRKSYKGRNQDAINKALEKARTCGLYIGMDRAWMEEEVQHSMA